jgi:carbon storage regulator
MLTLIRKKGQTIFIDGDIEIVVHSCHKSFVRLGIAAPKDTGIVRGEVLQKFLEAKESAPAKDGLFHLVDIVKKRREGDSGK